MILAQRIICISLLTAGIVIGLIAVCRISLLAGLIYGLLTLIGLAIINFSFCTKCTCRHENCGMIFPGKLTRLWPQKKQSAYNILDYTAIVLSLCLITLYPQYWLWSDKFLLMLFWLIFVIAHVHIRLAICRGCENAHCPALPRKPEVKEA